MPKAPSLAAHSASAQTVPPQKDKAAGCPSAGDTWNDIAGDVQSSTCLGAVTSREGQGAVALQLLHTRTKSGQAGWAVTRTSFGFCTVSPQSHLVALSPVLLVPGRSSRQERGGSCSAGSRL